MANQMLVDATHPEETRVVVVRGNRVEEFDFESANRKQLRGNIYLAKVTRVEPSLQAAFVDYGGNRHGFLAFSEIHPDYYQIPMADRQALLAEEHASDDEDDDAPVAPKSSSRKSRRNSGGSRSAKRNAESDRDEAQTESADTAEATTTDKTEEIAAQFVSYAPAGEEEGETVLEANPLPSSDEDAQPEAAQESDDQEEAPAEAIAQNPSEAPESDAQTDSASEQADIENSDEEDKTPPAQAHAIAEDESLSVDAEELEEAEELDEDEHVSFKSDDVSDINEDDDEDEDEDAGVEHVGAEDALEEVPERRARRRTKQYKIQEVIKRRQILLVQVVKEERGNKGAALTTYLSLAGRYSVLMPNTARGGGISRKITNVSDRKRLKQIASELEVADGMGVILRTAGASRTKTEIKRDFEYLLRLWENVRDLTMQSAAPMLVYEEGSLIKRSIRDLYNKDIDQVLVSGEEGYKEAKSFMRMLMPSHARNVQPYREPQPIFTRLGIEHQLDAMFSPQVTLKSGGYIVIDQTEALVSIDVNSGRSTREHNIEDTALFTNLEAAEEISRQLRLRDLAGLVVIDFIDMEEKRNNRAVEKRLKDCLKSDRARIQVGRISHFGLMEMSRQRIRTGVLESTMDPCPHCHGTGYVRAAASVALLVLRSIEDHLLKGVNHHVIVKTRGNVALYILNQKRHNLFELENRFGIQIIIEVDDHLEGKHLEIKQGEPLAEPVAPTPTISMQTTDDLDEDYAFEAFEQAEEDKEREEESSSKKRRRRRRRKKSQTEARSNQQDVDGEEDETAEEQPQPSEQSEAREEDDGEEKPKKGRRRGRRGGRRNRRNRTSDAEAQEMTAEAMEVAGEPGSVVTEATEHEPEATPAPDTPSSDSEAAPQASSESADASSETEASNASDNENSPTDSNEPVADAVAMSETVATNEPSEPTEDTQPVAETPVADTIVEQAADEQPSEDVSAPSAFDDDASSNQAPEDAASDGEPQEQEGEASGEAPSPVEAAPAPAEKAPEPEEQPEPEDNRPKRTGWWNRSGFL